MVDLVDVGLVDFVDEDFVSGVGRSAVEGGTDGGASGGATTAGLAGGAGLFGTGPSQPANINTLATQERNKEHFILNLP